MNKHNNQHDKQGQFNNQVLAYLNNSLSQAETRNLEESLPEDQMLVDAIEGLRHVNIEDASTIDFQIKNYINSKIINSPKKRTQISFPFWLFMTIVLLLILISIGYVVVTQLIM